MIITIAGLPGAGKTSAARELAKRLGKRFFSIGDLRGQMAMERGITIDELNASGTDSDVAADEFQKKLAATEDDIILEGRLSWYFVPRSFKVLMSVDPVEGARRIFSEKKVKGSARADEHSYATIGETQAALAARMQSDRERYQQLYGIGDFVDPKNFDLVVDTTDSSGPQENAARVMIALRERGLIE